MDWFTPMTSRTTIAGQWKDLPHQPAAVSWLLDVGLAVLYGAMPQV
jgi:hypothetical protein